jgi:hypothetical protein
LFQVPIPPTPTPAPWLALSMLDVFFIVSALISLGFNLWQWVKDKNRYDPIVNALIGVFNDLKDRELRAYQKALLLEHQTFKAMSAEALRASFWDFAQEMIRANEQLREHIASVIYTLKPEASTETIYKAAEFGLTPEERQFRKQNAERYMQQFATAQEQRAPQAAQVAQPVPDPGPAAPQTPPPQQEQRQG